MKPAFFAIFLFPWAFSPALSAENSVNPERTIYPLFEVFENYWLWGEEEVKVYGLRFEEDALELEDKYVEKGATHVLPKKFFEEVREMAKSVFEATPGDSSSHFGTAFHVGENLVLTNQHVLSVSRQNSTSCSRFRIKLNPNQGNKTLYCKEVHHCNKKMDYCLIEMWPSRRGQSLSGQKAPALNTNPSHSLEERTIAIGNTRGFGIHASMGKGFTHYNQGKIFYAPVFGGNSGGPVFNENGEVIAVVRAQSEELFSPKAYNLGISLRAIKTDLKKALGEKHPIFKTIRFK